MKIFRKSMIVLFVASMAYSSFIYAAEPAKVEDPSLAPTSVYQSRQHRESLNKKEKEEIYGLTWCEQNPRQCKNKDVHARKRWCSSNPTECDIKKREFHNWCANNPQKCADRRAQRKRWCDSNPEQCVERRIRDADFDVEVEDTSEIRLSE